MDDVIMMDLPNDLFFSMKLFKTKEIQLTIQNIHESDTLKLKFEAQNNSFLDKLMKRKVPIKNIVEMNLSGNQFKAQSEKYKLQWNNSTESPKQKNMVKSFEEKQKLIKEYVEIMDDETFIQIMPLEMRVFMINFS